jgi:endoglucanase
MKNFIPLISLFMLCISHSAFSQVEPIRLNSLGYLPNQPKIASVEKLFQTFEVIDVKSSKVVLKGKVGESAKQADIAQEVWMADFSKLKKPGTYKIKLNTGDVSPAFKIANDVYNGAFTTSMRAFYLWRCGTAVSGEYNGHHYAHEACHMNDGYLDFVGEEGKQKDGTGGWHDAGDHGKYVVNAGITVGMMFWAWDQFNEKLKKIDLGLPETAPGYPDFLKEMKWETDWVLKMAYPDGSGRVSHKLTRENFEGFVMPENDTEKRFFTIWSSAATADFVAMMAQAARYFKPYDAAYSKKCLNAALLSYAFLVQNTEDHHFEQNSFRTGGYQTNDPDDRLWAAAELWETTGGAIYLKDVEERLTKMEVRVDEDWDWGNVRNLGTFTYLMSKREGKNPDLFNAVKAEALRVADTIVAKAARDIYNRPLAGKYYWGCNGGVARQVFNLQVANKLKPNKKYIETSLDAISNIFGRNQYGRSFVTGLGYNPPMNPHCRRSGADGIAEPWPGYIVGGGNKATDWKDEEGSYQTNEIAINWQAALVYSLAGFIE